MKTIWKKMMVAGLLAGLTAGLCPAAEMVLDRQGGWEVVQSDDGNAASLFLVQKSDGARTCLTSVKLPTTTVTNSYWDEYAEWDESAGRPAGAMVTRVDTVGADFQFTAFVNDGQAYWEDWADGTARLWTAPCRIPDEKTLLATSDAESLPLQGVFSAKASGQGARWREAGTTMVCEHGRTRSGDKPPLAVQKRVAREAEGDWGDVTFVGNGGMYEYWTTRDPATGKYFPDRVSRLFMVETTTNSYEFGQPYLRRYEGSEGDFWFDGGFPLFVRAGYGLEGWFTATNGGTRVLETDIFTQTSPRTLYAHWLEPGGMALAQAVDNVDLTFTTGGDAPWYGQSAETCDGEDAARSGPIRDNENTWMETEVTGPGRIAFMWKTSCEDFGWRNEFWWDEENNQEHYKLVAEYDDFAAFSIDGETVARIGGRTDWQQESFSVGSGLHTFRWSYAKDGSTGEGLDCAWVDQVAWGPEGPAVQHVLFDANGGSCETETAAYLTWKPYGSLPEATRVGLGFGGWYTAPAGGTRVTESSIVPGLEFLPLYARWLPGVDGVAIANVVAHQRFPWNGLVDIDYEVFCDDPDGGARVFPEAIDCEHSRALVTETLSGDGAEVPVKAGRHRMTWDAKTDNPGAHSSALTVKMKGTTVSSQTISFATIGSQLPTNRVALTATATSGKAVTFDVVSGPGVIEGNVLSFTGEGVVEVRALQAGDDRWFPATALQKVKVEKVPQTIVFVPVCAQMTTNRVELSATATSGGTMTFAVVSGPGVIEGNVLSFTGAGTVEVQAIQTGDDRWSPATATLTLPVATDESELRELPYMVVDLSAGSGDDAVYPLTWFLEAPTGGWGDEYKTTKLVLRRIEGGQFKMCGNYQTLLTRPFFIGVFEVTQKQWELVMGRNPSNQKGDSRPVERVSYDMIRGSSAGAEWPGSNAVDSDSFLGKLRARTGQEFDLPTEAQWEYACRAGTTSAFNNGGNSESDLKQLGRYGYWSSGDHMKVGSYLPNAWGLYDMHGNVWEWCLDWYGSLTNGMADPMGPTSSWAGRMERGGCCKSSAMDCASFARHGNGPSSYEQGEDDYAHGLRLAMTVQQGKSYQAVSFVPIGLQPAAARVELSATATSGNTVTFEVVSGPAVIEGNVLTFTGFGAVEVRAVQAGDEQWLPATATQTVDVGRQVIAFASIGARLATDQVELSATATGGGEVGFEVMAGPGVIEGNVLSFTGGGTVEVRALQAGNDLWLPASATQTVLVVEDLSELSFMVLDLSAGSGLSARYPVGYLAAEPEGGWTDEYKTTKLVLRRIEPGTFMMGGKYQTTLTKPYYMGVFEVTQKQYELVTGGNPSYYMGDKRPVESVSYVMIRGSSAGAGWPESSAVDASSFLGKLRARTGLEFDLPTEAQWEYACRAGTTTDLNNGMNLTNRWDRDSAMDEVGRYGYNQSDGKGGYSQHTTVGSYLPNAWGLYDMHGNVWEWCLDWYGSLTNGATDPVGPSSGSDRVARGGSWASGAAIDCASFVRGSPHIPSRFDEYYDGYDRGFRLAMPLHHGKSFQVVSFAPIGLQSTAAQVELSATATSGGVVTFEVVSGPGVVTGSVLTFTGAGTVEVRAVQAGNERWLPATATQTVAVAKAEQTISFAAIGPQTPADRVELSATATSGLAVAFEVVSGPGVVTGNDLTFTGFGTVEVRAVQGGDERWLPASATQSIPVGLQTISFETIGAQTTADRVELSASATGGGTVTFEVVSGPGVLEGNVLSFTGGGAVEVRALQAGNDLWLPASATQTVLVVEDLSELSFMVLDLSAGSGLSARYPVGYLAAEPEGGWTDEYKTTKLVLRRIEPGTFEMGGSYQTTLTKPYYMGVFEVTQKQYELVTGSNPSYYTGDKRPVEFVSWNTIRGDSDTYNWPNITEVDADSFMGRLRARTGLEFDLPTEAQWEYACRAGTTSDYNNGGNTTNDLNQLGRYWSNRSDGKGGYTDAHTTVGSYLPNAWGLYDMHGNVWEWCLDWYGSLTNGATDPVGPSSVSFRVDRGGGWGGYAGYCTSSYRNGSYPSSENDGLGFRLVRTLSE